jgi:hypothetical protein
MQAATLTSDQLLGNDRLEAALTGTWHPFWLQSAPTGVILRGFEIFAL